MLNTLASIIHLAINRADTSIQICLTHIIISIPVVLSLVMHQNWPSKATDTQALPQTK